MQQWTWTSTLARFIRSRWFFGGVIALFILESAWIAYSARYPMAFDEAYHYGIIKLYAQQWSPLFTHQPAGPAPFGALTRDPSYLHHWLLSWPYRWLVHSFSESATIIGLRLINTALFAGGLIAFRRVLMQTRAGLGLIHLCLLVFVLIPVVPLLGAHINYDNLVMLLVPLNLLLLLRFRRQLRARRPILNVNLALHTVSLGLIGSLTKFAYLPVLTAITALVIYLIIRYPPGKQSRRHSLRQMLCSARSWQTGLAVAAFGLTSVLFVQMYGINIVRYHNVIAQCGQVLGVTPCQAYGPWARNYALAQSQQVAPMASGSPVSFAGGWLQGMFQRTLFVINGPDGPAGYANFPPLPVLSITAIAGLAVGVVLVVCFGRRVLTSDPVLGCLLFVSAVYLIALIGRNYHDYLQLGHLVAINGRYLLPILLPIMLALGQIYKAWLNHRQQMLVSVVVCLSLLQGGGTLSFIYFSTPAWYRPGSRPVLRLNQTAQRIVRPLTLNWPAGWWH